MIRRTWLLPATLVAAVLLMIMPLPPWMEMLRPYWPALVLIYWNLESDRLQSLGQAFVLGLVLDLVTGSLLGQNAMGLVIISYLLGRFRSRIRFFPPWQQALAVFALLVNDRIVQLWIVVLAERGWPGLQWWLPALVGWLVWPWLFLLLDAAQARLRLGRT